MIKVLNKSINKILFRLFTLIIAAVCDEMKIFRSPQDEKVSYHIFSNRMPGDSCN